MEIWEIHPALVHFPIALFLAGILVDLYAWGRHEAYARVATGLLLAGVATGAITAGAGALAYFTVPSAHTEAAHDTILWHLGTAITMFVLFLIVGLARWARQPAIPSAGLRVLGLVAAVVLIVSAYLGGHVVYHGAMGIEPQLVAAELREHHHHGEDVAQADHHTESVHHDSAHRH